VPTAVESFDPASPTMAEDRFDVLATLRSVSPVAYVPAIRMWAVTGYDAVREVLADPDTFRSGGTYLPSEHLPAEAFAAYPADGPLWRHSMVSADGEQHRRLRSAMTRAFTARRVRTIEPDIRADAELLAGRLFVDSDQDDLVAAFARPLPSRTIARFFGLPMADADRFSGWSDAFLVPQVPGLPVEAYVGAARQFAEFDAYVRGLLTGDLADVGEGLVRDLVRGRADGSHDLDEDELVGDVANVLFAGHETTVSTLSNLFVRLLRDRTTWQGLAAGGDAGDGLVEELLRLDTAGVGLFRSCSRETTVAGVTVPAGARLWVAFAAANRDPAAFDHPDRLDPARPGTPGPLTFGHGAHVCIGSALARTQVRAALDVVPRLFPTLRLDGPVREVPNFIIRSTPHVPVRR
jgi:cytochrome P450